MYIQYSNIAGGKVVIRFYDPDFHILEVGENMKSVCRRFLDSGMTIEAAAVRMNVPEKICACLCEIKLEGG